MENVWRTIIMMFATVFTLAIWYAERLSVTVGVLMIAVAIAADIYRFILKKNMLLKQSPGLFCSRIAYFSQNGFSYIWTMIFLFPSVIAWMLVPRDFCDHAVVSAISQAFGTLSQRIKHMGGLCESDRVAGFFVGYVYIIFASWIYMIWVSISSSLSPESHLGPNAKALSYRKYVAVAVWVILWPVAISLIEFKVGSGRLRLMDSPHTSLSDFIVFSLMYFTWLMLIFYMPSADRLKKMTRGGVHGQHQS